MRFARTIPLMLALLLGALSAAGCAECEKDYDCPGTQICSAEEGECVPFVCRADRDCPPGQTCAQNRCRETRARPAPTDGDPVVLQPGS